MEQESRIASALIGGLVLGVWIYGLLWGFGPDVKLASWTLWGILGLVLAGAAYGTRATQDPTRIILLAVMGVVTALVLMSAIVRENIHILATLTTLVGAGLISFALPPPGPTAPAQSQEGFIETE